ncbi:MAG: HAD hydrolase-like protein [Magnetococcales bacterium]|nr:HAD hydrolase-like protein [Magnetococcales bacterium]
MISPCHMGMNYQERKAMIQRFNALQIQAVAFDFDGVLADSVPIKDDALEMLASQEAPGKGGRAKKLWEQTRGIFRRERIGLVFKEVLQRDLEESTLDNLVARYKEAVFQRTVSAPAIAGSLEYLRSWPLIPSYIVSAAPQQEVVEIAQERDIHRYFRAIIGGPKKKNAVLAELIQREQCQPKELLLIGDSDSDHRAAQEVGASFLGVVAPGRTNPFPTEVRVVPDLTGLTEIIATWWQTTGENHL